MTDAIIYEGTRRRKFPFIFSSLRKGGGGSISLTPREIDIGILWRLSGYTQVNAQFGAWPTGRGNEGVIGARVPSSYGIEAPANIVDFIPYFGGKYNCF